MSLSISYFQTLAEFKIQLAARKRSEKEQGTNNTIRVSYVSDALCIQILKSGFLRNFGLNMKSQCLNL